MKVIVIGASHGIGLETVKQLLRSGHEVTAFSRHAGQLKEELTHLRTVDGDVCDKHTLKAAMKHHDAVICTLGLPTRYAIGPPFAKKSDILSQGMRNIVDVMAQLGIKRLLCVTAIGAGNSVDSCTPAARFGLRLGLRWLFKEKDKQEAMVRASSLEWTLIRPTALTNSTQSRALDDGKGRYGVLSHISRSDVASRMVGLLDDTSSYKKAVILSYPPRFGDSIRWTKDYLKFN